MKVSNESESESVQYMLPPKVQSSPSIHPPVVTYMFHVTVGREGGILDTVFSKSLSNKSIFILTGVCDCFCCFSCYSLIILALGDCYPA